jgi:hypothetical protein
MSEATADTSIIISLDSIQEQVQHCENILSNIDKIVPKLYKIRQQTQSQKEYINDINSSLLINNNKLTAASGVKVPITTDTVADATGLVIKVTKDQQNMNSPVGPRKLKNINNVDITDNNIIDESTLKNVIQSLFKYKHDQGTPLHFTSEQIDSTTGALNRVKGLNLSDIESITEGLNEYLSISSTGVDQSGKVKTCINKLFAPVSNIDTSDTLTPDETTDTSNEDKLKGPTGGTTTDLKKHMITKNRRIKTKRIMLNDTLSNINDHLANIRGVGLD